MPLDLLTRINLDYIYPAFLEKLNDLLVEARGNNLIYFATSGYRSTDDQRVLYEKHLQGGPLAAPAGLSAHNYGLAVDLARRAGVSGVVWDSLSYQPLASLCAAHGLVWGGQFGDPPHVQLPGYINGAQLLPLKSAWNLSLSQNPAMPELDRLKAIWQNI